MRINSINAMSRYNYTPARNNRKSANTDENVNFNGYCGKIAGILAGGAAAVGLSVIAAPALICAGPALAVAGMFAGDKAEDEINKAMDDKPEKD